MIVTSFALASFCLKLFSCVFVNDYLDVRFDCFDFSQRQLQLFRGAEKN